MHTTHIIQYDSMILAIRSTMLLLARVASPKYYTIVYTVYMDIMHTTYVLLLHYYMFVLYFIVVCELFIGIPMHNS